MIPPTLNGSPVFGLAVRVQYQPRPSAQQINTFFGINGVTLVWGGSRGRTFTVSGVLVGADIPSLAQAEAILTSYDDGIARIFTDTWGRAWPAVVFSGQYQPDPQGPQILCDGSGSWGLPYRCTLYSLY
jgi:hypothetical protein